MVLHASANKNEEDPIENKGARLLLVSSFVFAYVKRWFSHNTAHIVSTIRLKNVTIMRNGLLHLPAYIAW